MPKYLADSFCPELAGERQILDLVERGPIRPAVQALFGPEAAVRVGAAQIALRFPQYGRVQDPIAFHLDGYPSANNRVSAGALARHTLLVGIFLTRLEGPDRGNFVVWPGSHHRFASWFREHDVERWVRRRGSQGLLEEVLAHDPGGEPHQVEAEPGDVILAHHLLAHGAADNLSLHVREAIYFRVLHGDDDPTDPAALVDVTRFFDGVPW